MGDDDKRKKYVLKLASNYFKRDAGDFLKSSSSDRELGKFLDDLNTPMLVVNVSQSGESVKLSTDPATISTLSGKSLVFFKPRAEPIRADSMESSVLITSLTESPLDSLFQLVHNLFAPLIKQSAAAKSGGASLDAFDAKLTNNLVDLESNLKVAIRKLETGKWHDSRIMIKC